MEIKGPLASFTTGIAGRLKALGYTASTTAKQMEVVGRLSRFLLSRGLVLDDLSEQVVEEFFADLHVNHGSSWPTAKSLGWLVEYLHEIEVMPAPQPIPPQSRNEELLERYRRYLVDERGLARKTVVARERTARQFLAEHGGRELRDLDAGDVSRFVTGQCSSLSVRSAERRVNGLRSFFRYTLVEGLTASPLAQAVPSVARWSGASLPRGLPPAGVRALLASREAAFDRQTRLRHSGPIDAPRAARRRSGSALSRRR